MITKVPKRVSGKRELSYLGQAEITEGNQPDWFAVPPERVWESVHPYGDLDTAPDYPIGEALRGVQAATRSRALRSAKSARLSRDLALHLKQIVAWAPGWDGDSGQVISPIVAQRVEDLILAALDEGIPEPKITAASDGSLAVDWHFADHVVGLFVDKEGNLEPAAIMTESEIREVPISSERDLLSLLQTPKVIHGRAVV